MLVRRHIHKLLSDYYSQPQNAVVGSIQSNSIAFKSLLGEWHWRRIFSKLYKTQSGQWLTPVELFRPYYSQILANFIAEQAKGVNEVHVVELGGGRGTNASCILDHLQRVHPTVYDGVSYTIMDSSPTLLELQKSVVLNGNGGSDVSGHAEHEKVVRLEQVDMFDIAERKTDFLEESDSLTIIIGMEVLDNLPHDKLSICNQTGVILQTDLYLDPKSGQLKEVYKPLEDPLLRQMIDIHPSYIPTSTSGAKWVPTVATQVLTRLFELRPNAGLVLADFDWLPPPEIVSSSIHTRLSKRAEGEPLVTDMNDVDHECYLTSPSLCDVLFPTNFDFLSGYVAATMKETLKGKDVCPWTVNLKKQNEFLSLYGSKEVEETKSRWTGYSPLLEDFSNCSVLYVSRQEKS